MMKIFCLVFGLVITGFHASFVVDNRRVVSGNCRVVVGNLRASPFSGWPVSLRQSTKPWGSVATVVVGVVVVGAIPAHVMLILIEIID